VETGISCPGSPTADVLHLHDRVFLEAAGVVNPPGVACPEVEIPVAGVAAVSGGAEPAAVFVAAASAADAAEPRASVDIALASVVSVPVSAVAVWFDSSAPPRFFVFPNIGYYSSPSSSVEVVG